VIFLGLLLSLILETQRTSSAMSSLTLPLIDLKPLCSPDPSSDVLAALSESLSTAFSTTGFAYLVNTPISFSHDEIFGLAKSFFSLPEKEKLSVAKRTFESENQNTYRGFFPVQAGSDNLKEGFETGPKEHLRQIFDSRAKFNLTEANVWPASFGSREKVEKLYEEMQALSATLLSLLAVALGKEASYFDPYLEDSMSTLRLLHYPAIIPPSPQQELCCTPHTDSGILTLLHQDKVRVFEVPEVQVFLHLVSHPES